MDLILGVSFGMTGTVLGYDTVPYVELDNREFSPYAFHEFQLEFEEEEI